MLLSTIIVKRSTNLCNGTQLNHNIQRAALHLTSVMNKKKAGRFGPTPNQDFPLTYEQSQKPHLIGVTKGFNSFNTSVLTAGVRESETAIEDVFIRKFLAGSWPSLICSDIIIKRRANMIFCSFVIRRAVKPAKLYFIIGLCEEILSYQLKCIVKLELQSVLDETEMIYKYI